jgi:hypothetical protein
MVNMLPPHRSLLLVIVSAMLMLAPRASYAGSPESKADVCHVNGTGGYRILTIGKDALPDHFAHGDHLPIIFYLDADGDGYGDGGATPVDCVVPDGYSTVSGDCDEANASVNPAAAEVCDGLDNDCDGYVDEDACGCTQCTVSADCDSGICYAGRCQPSDTDGAAPVPVRDGSTVTAYVGCDGYVLLAHYGAAGRISGYNQNTPQVSSTSGGGTAPAGFYPTIDSASYGHLAMTLFNPAGKDVRMSCAAGPGASLFSANSNTLFTDFSSATKGTYGTTGAPGWGIVAAIGSGAGRSSHAICGQASDITTGGIGYCTGPGSALYWGNHLVSFYTTNQADSPYMGCNGTGQSGIDSTMEMWVWLEP